MPNRHLLSLTLALAFSAAATPSAHATAVPINNASFEADVLADDVNTDSNVSGWSSSIASVCSPQCFGAYNPGVGSVSIPSGVVPDGNNVLYMVSPGGTLAVFQALTGNVLAANTRYTLTVAVGNTADRADDGSFGFRLGVVGSDNSYAVLNGSLASIANGEFVDLSASSVIQAGNPDIGKTLVIQLFGPAIPGPGRPYAVFDNVRLDATVAVVPEPASLALFAPGLGLLGWLARRRLGSTR